MHQPVNAQKPMHYQIQCVFQEINVAKLTKNQLKMKEVIQCCLSFSLAAHLLEMGPVLAWSLYELKCSLCTYNHTVLLYNMAHFMISLRGGCWRSGIIRRLGDPLSVFHVHMTVMSYHLSTLTYYDWLGVIWQNPCMLCASLCHRQFLFPAYCFIQSSLYLVPTF